MYELGAIPAAQGTSFRVAAPGAPAVFVLLDPLDAAGNRPGSPPAPAARHQLLPRGDGLFAATIAAARPGMRYRLEIPGKGTFPDPASRHQPLGVHGPSEIVDPSFAWSDGDWRGPDPASLVIYELHVGTFTPAGTFAGVIDRLPDLAALGVNTIELMPIADFPGDRNWGYDPASLFAPARCYGRPEDLRRLVDAAHRIGLAVILDVVYNHLGPDGAYLPVFLPDFFQPDRHGPWGQAVNLDGEGSRWVRRFFVENGCYWVREFHFDGLRLDATHTLEDESPRHFLAEIAEEVRSVAASDGRRVVVVAEDERNLDRVVRPPDEGGWGLDGLWADDFHHQARRAVAGDAHGYYRDFSGSTSDIAETIRRGWFYTGQHSKHAGRPRGTDPTGLRHHQFVLCIQNHDQVGNRALGERLHAQVDLSTYLAVSVLLLAAPGTPLLFMGQEWAASTPFLYFTDHSPELGRLVTEGRRKEFSAFPEFADPEARDRIPDPQAAATFEASRLRWDERERMPHAGVLRFYQAMLRLRREKATFGAGAELSAEAAGEDGLRVLRYQPGGPGLAAAVRLRGRGPVTLRLPDGTGPLARVELTTEDPAFVDEAREVPVERSGDTWTVTFPRAGGLVLRWGQ